MGASAINNITSDEWKEIRKKAGVEKTPWYKGVGPSVASKVEAWQKAREKAKEARKAAMADNYVYDKKDGAAIQNAVKALEDLQKALRAMLPKAMAGETEALRTREVFYENAKFFTATIRVMLQECEQKLAKWNPILVKILELKKGAREKAVKDLFVALHQD